MRAPASSRSTDGCPPPPNPRPPASLGRQGESQAGQAVVETGLLLPLLVFLLAGVGFVGLAVVERQNVLIAARFAAREASMRAMAGDAVAKMTGASILTEANSTSKRAKDAAVVLGGRRTVSVTAPTWRYDVPGVAPRKQLTTMLPLGGLAHAYVAKQGKFGIGLVMYGQAVTSKGNWLDGIGSAVNQTSKLAGGKGKIWDKVGVRAEAYMPGELPVLTPKIGLLDLNPWIRDQLKDPGDKP